MIRIRRARLPWPLQVLVERDERGDLVLTIAIGMPAEERHAAIRKAKCEARRAGWLPGLIPLPLAGLLRRGARHSAPAAHGGLAGATAAAIAAAVIAVVVMLAPPSASSGAGSLRAPATARVPHHAHARRPDPAGDAQPAGAGAAPVASSPHPVRSLLAGTIQGVRSAVRDTRCTLRGTVQKPLPGVNLPPGPSVSPVALPSPLPTVQGIVPCPSVSVPIPTPSPSG